MKDGDTKRLTTALPIDVYRAFCIHAIGTGKSRSDLLLELIKRELKIK